MNHTITTTLKSSAYNFLTTQSQRTNKTKKSILEEALKQYQKTELKKQISEGLDERYDEYISIANDYGESQAYSIKI